MPFHSPDYMPELDLRGELDWKFGLTYDLPMPADLPEDADWSQSLMIVDDALHEHPEGMSFVNSGIMEVFMSDYGLYSQVLEWTKQRTATALEIGGLAAARLIAITYIDPELPLSIDEVPF